MKTRFASDKFPKLLWSKNALTPSYFAKIINYFPLTIFTKKRSKKVLKYATDFRNNKKLIGSMSSQLNFILLKQGLEV